jgi:hypothetical protein
MKKYLIVVTSEKKVISVFESEPISKENIAIVSKVLMKKLKEESKRYPSPKYDILIGTANDIHSIKQRVGTTSGWNSIEVEPLLTEV